MVGTGWWATQAHLPALRSNDRAELVAVADADHERLRRAADRFEVERRYVDFREMLDRERLDGVIVAVPHALHYEVALEALRNDTHVVVEKPFVLEPRHARHLLEEADARGRELIVGHPWNFNTHSLAARRWIEEGRIGDLVYVDSLFTTIAWELYRGRPSSYADAFQYPVHPPTERTYSDPELAGGGQGQAQVSHAASLLLFVTGLVPEEAFAFLEKRDLQVDLADAITVRFEGGCVGTLGSTGSAVVSHREVHRCMIYGTEGHVVLDLKEGNLFLHTADGALLEEPTLPEADRYPEAAPADNLVDVIVGRADNGSPGALGVLVVELLHAVYESASLGRPVATDSRSGGVTPRRAAHGG